MLSLWQAQVESVDKLTEKNYKTCKTKKELLLDVDELHEVTTSTSQEHENQQSDEWKELWWKLDKRAKLEIILNVDEKQ